MPIPAPNSVEAIDRLNALTTSATRYLDKNDWRLRTIAKLGRDLLRSRAVDGYNVLAGVAALTGDREGVVESADRALCISNDIAPVQAKGAGLANLGYFSEASSTLVRALGAQVLPIRGVAALAVSCGLIRALNASLEDAGNMPTAVPATIAAKVRSASAILERQSITDEDLGKWLDQLGEMLREKQLFFMHEPILFATREEDFEQVDISFVVDVSSEEAADMNLQLVERCFARNISPPDSFSFGFRSRRRRDERIAA